MTGFSVERGEFVIAFACARFGDGRLFWRSFSR
jgi:hypothetical protein